MSSCFLCHQKQSINWGCIAALTKQRTYFLFPSPLLGLPWWHRGDPGLTPGWEDPLEEGMATYSSILACRIPWTEGPGGLQSMGLQRIRRDWVTFFTSSTCCINFGGFIYVGRKTGDFLSPALNSQNSAVLPNLPGLLGSSGISSVADVGMPQQAVCGPANPFSYPSFLIVPSFQSFQLSVWVFIAASNLLQ